MLWCKGKPRSAEGPADGTLAALWSREPHCGATLQHTSHTCRKPHLPRRVSANTHPAPRETLPAMASRSSLHALRRIPAPLRNPPKTRPLCISANLLNSAQPDPATRQTHFGFETVSEAEKTERVAGVFHSVAESYDKMNDLMSFGWHRVWKCVPQSPSSLL